MSAIQQVMMAARSSAAPSSPYNTLVTAAAPLLWWKLDETSGTAAADSSGNGYTGTLGGGATFASAGVSMAAPSGYSGLGRGVNFAVASTARIQSGNNAALALGGSASGAWTLVLWVAGSAGTDQYIANRQNNQSIIYGYTANTVEFSAIGYSGSDPRTGSGISLPAADTTTPHMIVYRYNNGTWSGLKNGSSVFNVARSFSLPTSSQHWNVGAADASNESNCCVFDFQVYSRALSDAEIAALYAARDTP